MDLILTEKDCTTKELGRMIWNMETENKQTQMAIYTKEVSSTIKKMGKAILFIQANFNMKAFSKKIL